jgi:hypothetical protein
MYFKRRKGRAEDAEKTRSETRTTTIQETLGSKFKIRETRKFVPDPVIIDRSDKSVTLNILSDQFQGFKKQDRLLLQDVAIALEIAMLEAREPDKITEIFWRVVRLLTEYRRT